MRQWRTALWWLSVFCAVLAVFAHESGIAVLLVLPALLWLTGKREHVRARRLWPFAAIGVLFALAVTLANWRNPLLTAGDYRVGPHMLRHALDYVASLYVGPHAPRGYVASTAALLAVAAFGSLPARAGLMWMTITMMPFLGFLSGITSRYQYAPAMGFALMTAALFSALLNTLESRTGSRRLAAVAAGLCVIFAAGRFASFTGEAIRDRLRWFEAYRSYADAFRARYPVLPDGRVTAPAPLLPDVRPEYIQPMLRWVYERPDLVVTVEHAASRRPTDSVDTGR